MLADEELEVKDGEGVNLREAILAAGYEGGKPDKVRPEIKRFVEMHIEQGGVLENTQKQIGIVRSIVGQWGGKIEFTGHQNHAGTTPMALRRDPMPVMIQYLQELFQWVKPYEDNTVLTIGKIDITPGSPNVIPDKISLTFDIRSRVPERGEESLEIIMALKEKLEGKIGIQVYPAWDDAPVLLDQEGINSIEETVKELGYEYMIMDSGAGHDSQNMAKSYKTNMFFVPSVEGISHNEKEFTKPKDIEAGLNLMTAYIEKLAW